MGILEIVVDDKTVFTCEEFNYIPENLNKVGLLEKEKNGEKTLIDPEYESIFSQGASE